MNTGIQDAFNLGWKLALAVQGQAAPGLLDTYETERHPIARGVLRGTHLGTRLALARNPLMRAVRERFVPVAVNLPAVRRRVLAAISQLSVGYRESILAVDADSPDRRRGRLRRATSGLRAGDRVPDATLLDAATGEPVSLFDLFARGLTLLLFAGENPSPDALAQIERLSLQTREAVGDAVRRYLVLKALENVETTAPVLLDPNGKTARIFGARDGLAVLVRPDGYLGYRGRLDQRGELASYLARVFAMRLHEAERPAEASR